MLDNQQLQVMPMETKTIKIKDWFQGVAVIKINGKDKEPQFFINKESAAKDQMTVMKEFERMQSEIDKLKEEIKRKDEAICQFEIKCEKCVKKEENRIFKDCLDTNNFVLNNNLKEIEELKIDINKLKQEKKEIEYDDKFAHVNIVVIKGQDFYPTAFINKVEAEADMNKLNELLMLEQQKNAELEKELGSRTKVTEKELNER